MKILVADKFEQSGIDGLKAAGCEVIYEPDLRDDSLLEAIRTSAAAVLVVRSTKVNEAMMDAGRVSLIVRAGAGYENINVAAASARGIYVANCPGKNSIAVAELAFGLIIALDRRLADNVADLRAGRWNKKEYSKAKGLYGARLGLLGFGNIARELAKRALAFGMNIAVWSEIGVETDSRGVPIDLPLLVRLRPRSGSPLEPLVRVYESPEEVAANCDVLSVHLALSDRTRGLVGASVFNAMKPGASFVNTARGEVVDYAALAEAVKARGLRVALDVYAREPAGGAGEFSDPLIALPNVYGTHHIGASTEQAQEAIAAETVRIVTSFVETGRVRNVVNLSRQTSSRFVLVVRHLDKPGVLAGVFDVLRRQNVNVQETENVVFTGARAAVARINVDAVPAEASLQEAMRANADILDIQVVPLGAPASSYHLARAMNT